MATSSVPAATASVLGFHGGGFMGYFSALVAADLEDYKQSLGADAPLIDSFDLICGTSVGAIMAAGLAAGEKPSAISELMRTKGEKIFPTNSFGTKPGFFRARHSAGPLKEILGSILKDKRLGDLDRALLIPAINESLGKPVLFRSYDKEQAEIRLVDVVLASSAAPTFLPLHGFGGHRYADGGLVANGPALLAAADLARIFGVPMDSQRILTIGTTQLEQASKKKTKNLSWGAFPWVVFGGRLSDIVLGCQVELQTGLLSGLGPMKHIHLDLLLDGDEAEKVHFMRADQEAKTALKKAADKCVKGISAATRSDLDRILSRKARRIAYEKPPGALKTVPRLV